MTDQQRPDHEVALDIVTAAVTIAISLGADLFKVENAVARGIDEAGLGQVYVDIHG